MTKHFLHRYKIPVSIGLIVLFLFFIVSGVFLFFDLDLHKEKTMVPKIIVSPTIVPTPTATPSPTLTPTPVYTGYCLNIPVLMYHHVAPQSVAITRGFSSLNVDNNLFDQQMGYIASHGFTTLFAEDLVNALHNHATLPAKSIVISLDDGYDDVYNYAFPIAKKYGVKLTVMVPTGLLGVQGPTNSYYTWGQLKDMLGSGLVHVGNHTWSHYPVGSGNAAKDQYEIATAQKELQQNLGISPIVFAYPYGTNANVLSVHRELQQNGILGAFSTIGGSVQCDSFIYSLHRTRIGNVAFPAYGIF